MRYLITGGCGFIGFHVALELLKKDNEVIIIDNFNNFYDPALKFKRASLLENAIIYHEDILNLEKLEEIFNRHNFDRVIHLAAQPGVLQSNKMPEVYKENNIKGTYNVFECCRKHNIKNTVFASSSSVYRNNELPFKEENAIKEDISIYAKTKIENELLAKEYCQKYNLNMIGLRMFNVYGSHGRPDLVFHIFTEALLDNKVININGSDETLRDFTHVSDIVKGIIKASNLEIGFEIINLGNSSPLSLKRLISLLEENIGTKAEKIYVPKDRIDMQATFADINKAKELLNWAPEVSIEDGIKELVLWHKNRR